MGVEIRIAGKKRQINAKSYSVQEDSTPIDPADESGGTSQIDVEVPEWDGWRGARRQSLVLTDGTQGKTSGRVASVSEQNGSVQLTATSKILQLSALRTAQPYIGNLEGAIRYYLGLVGVTEGIVFEAPLSGIQVAFPGWTDDVYQMVARKLCPARSIEMSLVADHVVFRAFRGRKAVLQRLTAFPTQSIDEGSPAQGTKTTWYNTKAITNALIYPPGGWNEDTEVYSVNAREVKVLESVELQSSVTSVQQPTCVANVGPNDNGASVYTVVGTDGFPVPPKMWADYGGSLSVEINPDTRTLRITIVGMDFDQYAPYSIAVASGPSTMYSTLRILGTGVDLGATLLEHGTGLSQDDAPQEFSGEVDNIFLNNPQQVYDVTAWQVASARGPAHTIDFEADGINRTVDNGSYNYATFADFDAHFAGMTFAQADAEWAGKTTDDWDAYWTGLVSSDFRNQAFGNVAGARLYRDGCIYRIRSATNSQGKISGSAQADNTIADFDEFYAGMTIAQFDAMWAGKTIEEFDAAPFPGIR